MFYDKNQYLMKININIQKIYLLNNENKLFKITLKLLNNIINIEIKFNSEKYNLSLGIHDFLNYNYFKSKDINEIFKIINNCLKNNKSYIYLNDIYMYLTITIDNYNQIKFQLKNIYMNKNILKIKISSLENENKKLKQELKLIKIQVENFSELFQSFKKFVKISQDNISINYIKKLNLILDNLKNLNFNKNNIHENKDIKKYKLNWNEFKLNNNGLIPVITQDYLTDSVLMLAYMNKEAYEKTIKTNKMTYWSRSRNELWIKGNTSGNYQFLINMFVDCDKDTILAKVMQIGFSCHKGSYTCFS